MPLKKTKAILLRSIPYLENNAVLKTFSPFGMMDLIAYGIKRKQPHLLNPGTLLSITYYESAKGSMHTIKEVAYLIRFKYLIKNVKGIIFLGEIARTIQIVGREAQPNEKFEELIIHPLTKIDEMKRVIWLMIPWLIVHLLTLSGLLNIDMFSVESKEILSFLAKHKLDDIIEGNSITTNWHTQDKVSELIISLANYYQEHIKNRYIATELRKSADRISRY